jgi:ureidoglycolate hydrolase
MRISVQELTPEAFARYGQVMSAPNNGSRENFAAKVENDRPASARANLALIAASPCAFPLAIKALERHAHSNQAFMPLDVSEYLVVVCSDDGKNKPDLATLRAFRVSGSTGINYNRGTWHYGMSTIGEPGTFAMLVHEDGSAEDCHFVDVEPIVVER